MPGECAGLGMAELDAEFAELLPERTAMGLFNLADIWASNKSLALTQHSAFSLTLSDAAQVIRVSQ
jgi:hypothetical protein